MANAWGQSEKIGWAMTFYARDPWPAIDSGARSGRGQALRGNDRAESV